MDNSWIRESNLIEGVDSAKEDAKCLKAWWWFLAQPLNTSAIKKLHGKVMRGLLPHSAGAWRRVDVRVGPRLCPPWREVPELMDRWYIRNAGSKTEEKIKIAHIEFETVHPFIDGNGRVGRMVMNHQLVKAGFDPLCIKATDRWDYYEWFEEPMNDGILGALWPFR